MISVRISRQAARDLLRIAEYLSSQSDSGKTGDRFLVVAASTAELLASTPVIGRLRPSLNPHLVGLRSVTLQRPFDRYVFYYQYQVGDTFPVIVRVLHTAQNAGQLLNVQPERNN